MAYRIIDLFSGAGGLSAGFLYQTGNDNFESILAIDNDEAAAATFNANFGEHCIAVNIEEWLTCNVVPQADLVIGGPPCQGFSLLNKNRGGDARRALWEPYMDVVEKSNASVFVMENVQGLLKSDEFQDILNRAKSLGFDVDYQLLNTADYGVPQTRKRAIIIGTKECDIPTSKKPLFPPEPTHSQPGKNSSLPSWRTVFDAMGDLPEPVGTTIRNEEATPLNLHFGRNPTELSMKRYRVVPPGGNRFDLQANAPEITPNCWLKKPSGGTDLFGRLWWDRPSVTIRTEFFKPEKGRYLHPIKHRPITHREAARIMSFPDDFIFNGSKTEIARQIGNAVPPAFARHIAEHAFDLLNIKVRKND